VGDSLTLHDSVYRGMLRKEGVYQLVLDAWRRAFDPTIGQPLYLDRGRLAAMQSRVEYEDQISALKKHAKSLLSKSVLPPLRQDYMSSRPRLSRWPTSNASGEYSAAEDVDEQDPHRERLQLMFDNVTVLAIAGAVTGERAYSDKAMQWLRAWFLDGATRLLPTLRGAQSRRVRMRSRARARRLQKVQGTSEFLAPDGNLWETMGTGIVEFRYLYYVLDAVLLLVDAGAVSDAEHAQLRAWMAALLASVRSEKYGELEWHRKNHHGLFMRMLLLALSNFVRDSNSVTRTVYEFNPLLAEQTRDVNNSGGVFFLERGRPDCRYHVALTSHAWLLALALTQRLGARLDEKAVCKAVYLNMIVGQPCKNQTTTLPRMKTRETMVVNAWRHMCTTSRNLDTRPDVSGSVLPHMLDREHSLAPYWNLMSAV